MPDDIPFDQLLDLVEGRLDRQRAAALQQRIDAGAGAATVAWLARFHRTAGHTSFVTPPAELLDRLHAMMPARPGPLERLAGAARSWTARLVEDLTAGPLLAGARGAQLDHARQLLFEAGDGTDVVLRGTRRPDGTLHLDGQVLAEDPRRALRLQLADAELSADTDEFGEFTFDLEADHAEGGELTLLVEAADGGLIHIDLATLLSEGPRKDAP